jgi:ketosteroid isomerase-like protein
MVCGGEAPYNYRLTTEGAPMDDLRSINAAKTEFRECYNLSDPSRLLSIADPDLVSFSDGQPSEFGISGLDALKIRLEELFQRFKVELSVIVMEIRIHGDVAHDYGCHAVTLRPKDGGQPIQRKDRYMDVWRRSKEGKWKLWMYMDNLDVADPFQPEQIPSQEV